MGLLNIFRRQDDINTDWRDLDALPKEVISKNELDELQNEVIQELKALQGDTINQSGEKSTAKPQTLYYYHKYIDAKFNKNDFNINTYFSKKQNIIDYKYAEGIGDIQAELAEYEELYKKAQELERRYRVKIAKLDPTFPLNNDINFSDDTILKMSAEVNALPQEIHWHQLEEEVK